MGDVNAAKDIRIFHMNPWLIKRRDKALKECETITVMLRKRSDFTEKIGFLIAMARDLGAYGYLIYLAAAESLTVGEFVLYFGAVTGFSGFVTDMLNCVGNLRQGANSADYYRAYMDIPEEDVTEGAHHINELKSPLKIEFKNMSFAYKTSGAEEKERWENAEKTVFKDFNLKIKAGEKIALVGVNGAGKTTLVKLLCGMYEPDEGDILINDISIKEFPKQELYKLFSVVFQEKLELPVLVGENLTMEKIENVDEDRAWRALEQAGLKDVFDKKKIKMDSYMTHWLVKDGVELSGGQWQRFSLARALYKDGKILVLDEPTAALDPIAESQIYDCYNKYTEGKTSIFISHRLASTRFSDRIVMIENGRIIEEGSHEELMAAGGAYGEMYKVQSNYYADNRISDREGLA